MCAAHRGLANLLTGPRGTIRPELGGSPLEPAFQPPVVFSRLLGFHQNTADDWQREAVGFGAEYAADLSRR
jgi:hypothetical protein